MSLSNSLFSRQEGRGAWRLWRVTQSRAQIAGRKQSQAQGKPHATTPSPLNGVHDSCSLWEIQLYFFFLHNLWYQKCILNSQFWEQHWHHPQMSHSKFLQEIRIVCPGYFHTFAISCCKASQEMKLHKNAEIWFHFRLISTQINY